MTEIKKEICSRCKGDMGGGICGCCKTHPSNISSHIQPKPNLDDYDRFPSKVSVFKRGKK